MITERLTFRAKYGQGDALVGLMKESLAIMPSDGILGARIYTDHTGPMFSGGSELDHADIGAYDKTTCRIRPNTVPASSRPGSGRWSP